ncbi:Hypp130 [Branchiostoma lanceolatum]|uniref:Hypp130 protein n=1 Tax=Branchiostoma lanceolatum TaxID=7740 RepID=A0A8J9VX87_BRALA|nr:Hypp130 [Branchiostoma lanceolatum]
MMTGNPEPISTRPNGINPQHRGKPGIVRAPFSNRTPPASRLSPPECTALLAATARPGSVLSPENLRPTTR